MYLEPPFPRRTPFFSTHEALAFARVAAISVVVSYKALVGAFGMTMMMKVRMKHPAMVHCRIPWNHVDAIGCLSQVFMTRK